MIRLEGLVGVLTLALWIFCLIDVLTADEGAIRNLPKLPWAMIVLFFPLIGSIAWLVAGRPESRTRRPSAFERPAPAFPEYDRPGRAAAADAEDDEKFLRQVRERAEEQRRRHREQQRRDAARTDRAEGTDQDGGTEPS